MSFSRKLLAPGEEIVLETHPNWSILLPRLSLAIVVIAGCVAVVIAWSSAPLWVGYILLAIGLLSLAAVLAKIVMWRSTLLVITNARVVYRTGALRRFGREIPLSRVQDVTYRQSLVERILGAGSLTVESAGQSGREPFPDIARPATVQSLINSLTFGSPGRPGAAGSGGGDHRAVASGYGRPSAGPPQPPGNGEVTAEYDPAPSREPTSYGYDRSAYGPVSGPPPGPPSGAPWATSGSGGAEHPSPTVLPPRWVGVARDRSSGTTDEGVRSSSEELARLVELYRLGVITDAELADKRRELLGGQ